MNVFITGGTSGLGQALAKEYLDDGHRVGVCGRDLSKIPSDMLQRKSFMTYQADVLDLQSLKESVESFVEGEHLDLMVANAGRSVGKKTKTPNFQTARDVIDVNVKGVLNSYEVALAHMKKDQAAHLCAISSVAGFMGLPGASSYSSSKAAVTILNESLSIDLEEQGISVTTICPGFVDTPLTKKNNHSMPFIMSAEKAARLMKKALDKKRRLYVFPWQMKWVVTILSKIPRSWYRKVMTIKFFNYSS